MIDPWNEESDLYYDCVTLHRRPIFGGKQKYRKVFYALFETRKDTTDMYKLESKSDSKGQATDEARLLFKDYYPNRWRNLHVEQKLVPVKHRTEKFIFYMKPKYLIIVIELVNSVLMKQ